MCTEPATAGLGYDVPGMRAWIVDLDAATMAGTARHRDMLMALCRTHADRIRVPVGWEMDDRRAPAPIAAAVPDTNEDPAPSADAAPLFRPRMRPEPAEMPGPATEPAPAPAPAAAAEPEPAPASLLERAFRAAPAR